MTTAREIMTTGTECIGENESVAEAARMMRDLDVGALPICGEDNRLKGMITDRDIAVGCVAEDGDPSRMRSGDFGHDDVVTIGADADIGDALRTMKEHRIRRLPVIEGHDLVGMISQADVARSLAPDRVGDLVGAISV